MTVPAAIPHRYRLWAIVLLTALDVAALIAGRYVAPELVEEIRALVEPALLGALAVLAPALYDAIRVERRRRTPGVPALPDDVIESGDGQAWPEPSTRPDRPSARRGPADGGVGLGLLIVAAACSAALHSGCGASALDTHTRALAVLVQTHREAGEVADGAYQRALDAATTAEEVDAAEERWSPVARSLDAAREAILAYGAALGAAVRDARGDDWMLTAGAALARAIRAWTALGVALREAGTGIELPELPGTVLGLADLALAAGGDVP